MIYNIERIGDIKLVREIGEGGMGVVYEGYDTSLDRRVAVKFMLPNTLTAIGRKRFLKEASAMAKINHPGIINVYSYDEAEIEGKKVPYFVMEFIEGKSLQDVINRIKILKENNPDELKEFGYLNDEAVKGYDNYFLQNFTELPLKDTKWMDNSLSLISSVSDALYEMHNIGIIHRDIKPSNILISRKGVKLADFGLVKFSNSNSITTQENFLGTIKYTAPEIFSKGKPTAKSDMYSLGIVFYELLTATHPFEYLSLESPAYIVNSIIKGDVKPPDELNDSIPKSVSKIVMKMLSKNPDDRYETMKDVSEAIRSHKKSGGINRIITNIKDIFSDETEKDKNISETDREISNEYLNKAVKSYFSINLSESIGYIKESLYLNPFNLDDYILYLTIKTHGYGFIKKIESNIKMLKENREKFSERDKEKLEIIIRNIENDKKWLDYALNYSRKYTEPLVYQLVARSSSKYAVEYYKKLLEFDDFKSYANVMINMYQTKTDEELVKRCIELKKENNENNFMFLISVILIENYLWKVFKLDKAKEEIDELEKKFPYHEVVLDYKQRIEIVEKRYEQAITTVQRLIGVIDEDYKFNGYYELYLLYSRLNETERALKYLNIAKNMTDETLLTVSEADSRTKNIDPEQFDLINKNLLKFAYSVFQKTLIDHMLESIYLWFFKVNLKMFVVESNGECLMTYMTSGSSAIIDFIPLGNFYDIDGNLLKTRYNKTDDNNFYVAIDNNKKYDDNYSPAIFIGTKPDVLTKKDNDTYLFSYSEKINGARIAIRIFAIDKSFEVISSDLVNAKEFNTNEYKIIMVIVDTLSNYSKKDFSCNLEIKKAK